MFGLFIFRLNIVELPQIAADVLEVGVDEPFREAQHAEAFDEVLLAVTGNDDFVEHLLVADVLQLAERVVHREAGLLRVHPKVLVRGSASQDLVLESGIVMKMLERRQEHFLRGVRVDGVNASAEAFHLVETVGDENPDAGVRVGRRAVRFRGEKYGDQRRARPVEDPRRQTVMLHQRYPVRVVVFFRRVVGDLHGANVEIVREESLHPQTLLTALDGRNESEGGIVLAAVPKLRIAAVTVCEGLHKVQEFVNGTDVYADHTCLRFVWWKMEQKAAAAKRQPLL